MGENIAILEKEISELLKGSELSKFDSQLDSMDEWEVVDKPSIQMEMQPDPQQFMSSADYAKMKIGDLQRSFSAETTELLAKVDGIKESVKEQEALRLLERENSLELLDLGGTGGPVEQEAALLLERVDQGFTQIITDQSESHLMTSLKKELTPEKLESDTSLEEHEREKMHQPQLMRQILEMQRMEDMEDKDENQLPTFPMMQQQGLDDSMKSDEQIAAELHQLRLEKDQQVKMQDTKVELEAITKMRQTITEMKEGTHGFQLSSQLDTMTTCLAEVEEEILHMKTMMKTLIEISPDQQVCKECKQEVPKEN